MTVNRAMGLTAGVMLMVVAVTGCGGGTSTETTATTTTTTTTTATDTSPATTPDLTTTTTGTVPPLPGGSTAVDPGTGDLLAWGEQIYQETAGGYGCQDCHGRDAKGSVDAPGIIGASRTSINEALGGGIVEMDFDVKLTIEEIGAVATYLQHLATLP